MRFYVRPDALAPVTTRALVLTDPDGTELALPAGTPVDSDPVVVAASWWLVRAALPADAIGTTYRADPIRATTRIRDESTHVEAHVRPRVRGEPAWSRYDTEPPVDLPPGVMRIRSPSSSVAATRRSSSPPTPAVACAALQPTT